LPRDAAPERTDVGLPNSVVGMLIFLSAEAMFFAGLIRAFLDLRANSLVWPPPDQPRLPAMVTLGNVFVLLLSGAAMWRAMHALRTDDRKWLQRWLGASVSLGLLFLIIQGSEWVRLLRYGFHAAAEIYGGIFYTIIGCHALHVAGGLVVLANLLRRAAIGQLSTRNYGSVEAARLYWSFVVGLWPLLYALVYLL
jgi:heme/copper-type cytochrome/quinol oxidase subunit 3